MTGAGAYEALFRHARRRDGDFVQLLSMPASRVPGRAGFVLARKALPRAVDRNRIRRLFREALRRARPAIEAHDVILRLKRGCPRTQFRAVGAEAGRLLAALAAETPAR
ncbi:MAG: ribonuclease P protein component [Betaproteobacteria bacterium]